MKIVGFGVFVFFFLFINHFNVSAQSINTSQMGLRLGGFSGIEFRHITSHNIGLRGNLLSNYHLDGTIISGMVEKHIPVKEGFVFYLGGGLFASGWHDRFYDKNDHYWDASIGLQGVVGIDYYFEGIPINLGADLTPRFTYADHPLPWDAALTIRYIF
ncbi:MAG: hypothetical protein ABIQ74_05815 [Chitinophagales bacterium]